MGLGIAEFGIVVIGLLFSLLPIAVAVWAIVMIFRLKGQVETLERRVASLEGPPPPTV